MTLGLVFDLDNWRDCGIGYGWGLGGGASVGVAGGVQYFQGEFEGWGIEVDVNAGAISPSGGVTLDDNGNITGGWGGLSKGPGIGACALVTKSNSFTVGNALDRIRKAWNWAKSWF